MLHALEQLHQPSIVDAQHASERRERPASTAVLLVEEVFERILGLHAPAKRIAAANAIDRGSDRNYCRGRRGEQQER
jgi:hypothetical protein